MGEPASTAEPAEMAFSRSLFGFDPLEVRAHVAELNDQLARFQARNNGDVPSDAVADDQDVAGAIDSTVNDIAEVLEAARVAAKKIRDRAERQASDGNAMAARQVREILAAAETDAFAVRKSAWDTSTELLESAKAEGARLRSAAERDALDIIGDAERKAHRNLAAARRDSDNAMQVAGAESERLMGMARAKAKEIIRAAEDRAATILDQVSALEKQHDDLRHDVEALRAELEGPSGGSGVREPSTVRVVPRGATTAESSGSNGEHQPQGSRGTGPGTGPVRTGAQVGPTDGTRTVRLVSAPSRKDRVQVDASEMADAVAALSREGPTATAGRGLGGGDEEVEGDTNPAHGPLEVVSPGSADQVHHADSSSMSNGSLDGTAADELAALFDELRMREATTPAAGPALSGRVLSPLERYDFELLPIVNRAVRGVKRQLTDIQREQVKALEQDPEGWMPERPDFGPYLVHALSVMEREACERGFVTAAELSGRRLSTPRSEASAGEGRAFIDDLFDTVAASIRIARKDNRSGRDISSDLSRVFRRWRTVEVDRRLRLLAGRAYHRGLVDGLAGAGTEKLQVVADDGCDTCSRLVRDAVAPDDLPAVPVHEGCRCTVMPA